MQNGLKEIRQAQKLALYGLATMAGVSPSLLSAVEKWGYVPSLSVRERIAKALKVEPSAIWQETPDAPNTSPTTQ